MQDAGTPSLSAERDLTVHVLDENDNAPKLSSQQYTVSRQQYTLSVPENTPVGTSVFSLEAADTDIGVNARLVYSLSTASSAA